MKTTILLDYPVIHKAALPGYFEDLALPMGIIAGALFLGILIERLFLRYLYRVFERRDWRIGRRLVRSFNGIITIWFGLAAFRSVLPQLPFKPSAVPPIEHTASAIFLLSIAVLIARIAVAFIRTHSSQHERAVPSISLIENIVRAVIYILGILMAFHAFGIAVTPLLAALGVGGLAVALALQDTLSNFFAGIYIILSKNIDPGDYVRLDSGQEGVIRDIAWRVTTLETPMSSLIIVPNSKFSTSIITNFDRPDRFMNLVIDLPIEPNGDARKFEELALESARDVQKSLPGVTEGEPSLRYTAIASTGATVQLLIRVTDFAQASKVKHVVLKSIYEKMDRSVSVAQPAAPAQPKAGDPFNGTRAEAPPGP